MQRDDFLRLRNLSIQVGDQFPGLRDCLWIGNLTDPKLVVSMRLRVSRCFLTWARCQAILLSLSAAI